MKKRIISLLMAVLMLVTMLPVSAMAEELTPDQPAGEETVSGETTDPAEEPEQPTEPEAPGEPENPENPQEPEAPEEPGGEDDPAEEPQEDEAATANLSAARAKKKVEIVASGYCGDESENEGKNVKWSLDKNGLLTISGSGAMGSIEIEGTPTSEADIQTTAPWFSYSSRIKKILVKKGITLVVDAAFAKCYNLTSVTLENGVQGLGSGAFGYCRKLNAVKLPNSLIAIGSGAFEQCTSLTKVTIPQSVEFLVGYTFIGCSKLTSISLPNNPKFSPLAGNDFKDCTSLSTITIPANFPRRRHSFYSVDSRGAEDLGLETCRSLKAINVAPDSVGYAGVDGVLFGKEGANTVHTLFCYPAQKDGATYKVPSGTVKIGEAAFSQSKIIRNVTLPDSVTNIEKNAFQNCTNLKKLTLHKSVTSIAAGAFSGCTGLTDIYFGGSAAEWNAITVGENNEALRSATIHYGENDIEAKSDYEENNYYKNHENRNFFIYTADNHYPLNVPVEVRAGDAVSSNALTKAWMSINVSARIPADYKGNVSVSMAGYFPYSFPVHLSRAVNRVLLTPTSETGPFCQSLLLDTSSATRTDFAELLVEEMFFKTTDLTGENVTPLSRLYPVVNWNGHGAGKIWLMQKWSGTRVELNEKAFNALRLGDVFRETEDDPIYIYMEAADGTISRMKTKITIVPSENTLDLDLGEAIEIDTAQSNNPNLGILGAQKFKFDMSKWTSDAFPITLTWLSDGTVKGTIGIGISGSYSEAAYGKIKESFKALKTGSRATRTATAKELKEALQGMGGTLPETSSTVGVSGKVQFIGAFTGMTMPDGSVKLTEMETIILGSGKGNYIYNTFVSGVPAYFEAELAAKIEYAVAMVWNEKANAMTAKENSRLDTEMSLSLGIGAGAKALASCGVKGTGMVKAYMNPYYPLKTSTALSISGNIGVVGTIMGAEGEWTLLKSPEKVFWDEGDFCWVDVSQSKNAQHQPKAQRSVMRMSSTSNAAFTGVSGYGIPALAQLPNDDLLAVWTADAPGRGAGDRTAVYFSVYSGGTWTEPQMVWDDGTNDVAPVLHTTTDEVWLSWQNSTETFGDATPELSTRAEQVDVAVAVFSEADNCFEPAQNLACAGYDYACQVQVDDDDVLTAAWSNNDGQVYVSTYGEETGWSAPAAQAQPEWYNGGVQSAGELDEALGGGRVFAYYDNYVAISSAQNESGNSALFARMETPDGWGEPVQLVEAPAGCEIGGYGAVMNADGVTVAYIVQHLDADGNITSADLALAEHKYDVNLTVETADYVKDTLIPGEEATLVALVKNNSLVTVTGLNAVVSDGTNTVQSTLDDQLLPGEEALVYMTYDVPETPVASTLTISITPSGYEDTDPSDNTMDCALHYADLSIENVSATKQTDGVKVDVVVANRGMEALSNAQIVLRANDPDGTVVATETVPALAAGETILLTVSVPEGLSLDDMVYVEGTISADENLYGNNTSQAMVIDPPESSTPEVRMQGDVNGDNQVTVLDIACLYEYLLADKHTGDVQDIDYFQVLADVNSDGAVDVYDLQLLYETVSGIA